MSVSCLPHPVAVSAFMICRGLCACTEMLWMCVLHVSFGSKVRLRTFGCVAMGSALLFIVRSRLLVYSAGSGVNRVTNNDVYGGPINIILSSTSSWLFERLPVTSFLHSPPYSMYSSKEDLLT